MTTPIDTSPEAIAALTKNARNAGKEGAGSHRNAGDAGRVAALLIEAKGGCAYARDPRPHFAAARELVPALAAEIARLTAENDRLAKAWEAKHADQVKQSKDHAEYFEKSQLRMQELVAERDEARAQVAETVKYVWGRCEALEDEAYAKLEKPDALTEHERGFWRGQKMVAKSIRRSAEMPSDATAARAALSGLAKMKGE